MNVSIALGTYNGERFLQEQLDSLAQQTELPCELVVCDDVSSDRTWDILERFAQVAPFPVRLVRNEKNLGWQDNFVKAASLCKGEWVAFCDQDDVWLPRKLETIAATLSQHHEVVMVVHSATLTSETLRPLGSRLPHFDSFQIVERLHNQPLFTQLGFATCFKRELLQGIPVEKRPCDPNIPARRQSHDQLITLLANALGEVAYLPNVLALYRRHGAAATGAAGTGSHERNIRSYLRGLVAADGERYSFQSEIALRNAEFLTQAKQHQPPAVALRLETAAEFYRLLGLWLSRRSKLYQLDQSTVSRIKLLGRAVRGGAYEGIGRGIGLGRNALLKDVAAVALCPLFKVARRAVSKQDRSP